MAQSRALLYLFLCVAAAGAVPITYEIEYDPLSDTTEIYNLPTSQSWLQTFIGQGGARGSDAWLEPGKKLTVQGGNRTGGAPFGGYNPLVHRHFNVQMKPLHIDAVVGSPMIRLKPNPTFTPMVVCTWLPVGGCYEVTWRQKGEGWRLGDPVDGLEGTLQPYTTDDMASVLVQLDPTWFEYPYGYYPAGQLVLSLNSGRIRVETDTDSFISVATANAGTGCVPEPASVTLLAVGGVVVARRRRRA